MTSICRYGFGTESALGFDLLTEKLEEILSRRGFNITTRRAPEPEKTGFGVEIGVVVNSGILDAGSVTRKLIG